MDRKFNAKRPLEGRLRPLASCVLTITILGLATAGCRKEPQSESPQPTVAADTSRSAANLDPDHPVVRIDTNLGAITVRLDAANAPGTVRNFLNYVTDDFYANTLFHYVAPEKMILGGGYTVDGQPKPTGTSIRNEAHNGLKNLRGTIAMARNVDAGIDTATSQFFINLADAPSFDHRGDGPDDYGFCVFGEVTDGLNVAERISRSATRDQGGDLVQAPDPPVVIQSIHVVR